MTAAARFASKLQSRRLGEVRGEREGPQVVISAGIHGNEPAGVVAIGRVLEQLADLPLRGSVMGLAGNLRALQASRRYLSRDLNRNWSPEGVARVRAAEIEDLQDEDREQRELLDVLVPLLEDADEAITFLDLHSASGEGAPFSCMADVLRNRRVAFRIPIPVVLGLEEAIEGAMLGWLCDLGHVGVAVEGGSHEDPGTVDRHESAIWCALVAAGSLLGTEVPGYVDHRRRLQDACEGLPHFVEIRHRHVVDYGDGFEMTPGYRNFQHVDEGEVVAKDKKGPVATEMTGMMMLPRYQGQGEDGYFLARRTARVWLDVSAALRAMRLERLLTLAPGVHADPERAGTYVADAGIARWRTTDVFHLFGYRRARARDDGKLVYSRRRPDRAGVLALPRRSS